MIIFLHDKKDAFSPAYAHHHSYTAIKAAKFPADVSHFDSMPISLSWWPGPLPLASHLAAVMHYRSAITPAVTLKTERLEISWRAKCAALHTNTRQYSFRRLLFHIPYYLGRPHFTICYRRDLSAWPARYCSPSPHLFDSFWRYIDAIERDTSPRHFSRYWRSFVVTDAHWGELIISVTISASVRPTFLTWNTDITHMILISFTLRQVS